VGQCSQQITCTWSALSPRLLDSIAKALCLSQSACSELCAHSSQFDVAPERSLSYSANLCIAALVHSMMHLRHSCRDVLLDCSYLQNVHQSQDFGWAAGSCRGPWFWCSGKSQSLVKSVHLYWSPHLVLEAQICTCSSRVRAQETARLLMVTDDLEHLLASRWLADLQLSSTLHIQRRSSREKTHACYFYCYQL